MKRIFTLLLVLAFCTSAVSQEVQNKQYYLEKSKKQRKTAFILIGGGVVIGIIGLSQINLAGSVDGDVNNTPGTILFATGGVATITGLVLFGSSNRNKKRAMKATVGLDIKKIPPLGLAYKGTTYPSLNIKIQL